MKPRIPCQMEVRHTETGETGVTVDDLPGIMACCAEWETPVVWDGTNVSAGTDTDKLEVIRKHEPKADYIKCGGGQGAECCIFSVGGPNGAECARHGSLRWTLIFKKEMVAQRNPPEAYPSCQKW